jgi:hypothetical protein
VGRVLTSGVTSGVSGQWDIAFRGYGTGIYFLRRGIDKVSRLWYCIGVVWEGLDRELDGFRSWNIDDLEVIHE